MLDKITHLTPSQLQWFSLQNTTIPVSAYDSFPSGSAGRSWQWWRLTTNTVMCRALSATLFVMCGRTGGNIMNLVKHLIAIQTITSLYRGGVKKRRRKELLVQDGFQLPSPLALAGTIMAQTKRVQLSVTFITVARPEKGIHACLASVCVSTFKQLELLYSRT